MSVKYSRYLQGFPHLVCRSEVCVRKSTLSILQSIPVLQSVTKNLIVGFKETRKSSGLPRQYKSPERPERDDCAAQRMRVVESESLEPQSCPNPAGPCCYSVTLQHADSQSVPTRTNISGRSAIQTTFSGRLAHDKSGLDQLDLPRVGIGFNLPMEFGHDTRQ